MNTYIKSSTSIILIVLAAASGCEKPKYTPPLPDAPEIVLPDVDGNTVRLSSMRGKYVLLEFWASWCGGCRYDNPSLLATYNKFKGKNFTILGVSLDTRKDDWLKAIQDDGLTWTQVSELRDWSSSPTAASYNVHSIPDNFLITPDGKILAHNLVGKQLNDTLQRLLK